MQTEYHYTYRDFHPDNTYHSEIHYDNAPNNNGGLVIGLPLIFTVLVFIFVAIVRKK